VVKAFEFLLILADVDVATSAMAEAIYDAGCDDGTLFSSGGEAAVGFTREASSLEEAVRSAIADVTRAGYSVSRVEPAEAPVFARINEELAVP
jgi:hypothetical protein